MMFMRPSPIAIVLLAAIGCGPAASGDDDDGGDVSVGDARPDSPGSGGDADVECPPPPVAAGPEVQLAPPFDTLYTVYDLGPVPGVPNPLGGAVVKAGDPSRLWIAGASERPEGAIYEIEVERDACGHIIGWRGTATQVAATPYVDANLVYLRSDLLIYTEWPRFNVSQLPAGASAPAATTDLRTIGLPATGDQGPGGIGLVPPGLAAAGQLRLVTWPVGAWVHAAATPGPLWTLTSVTQTQTLPNNPGGFAYVPAGSPGFATQAIIVAEWRQSGTADDRVAVYDADAQGDPIVSTRREFMRAFPRPWGAYFEPVTGDYLFLSWGLGTDRVYVVQGFVPPPPIL
jgi:hypothetical protein